MKKTGRIAFVGTSRSGLGHLRRLSNIASHVASMSPGSSLVLMSNAPPDGLRASERAAFSDITVSERRQMSAALAGAGIDLAVMDTLKVPDIASYSGAAVLILRETPGEMVEGFRRDDGRPWDRVIVPNPAEHWMPPADKGFARFIDAAGWILQPTGPRTARDTSTGLVVATGGGGTDGTRAELYPLLDAVIARARQIARTRFSVRQAIGPRAGGAAIAQADETFDPGGDLNAVFRAADLVISTAGYNSVLELASTDTPTLLAAIPRSLDDQAARVRLWGPRLGHGLDPLDPVAAAHWLALQIDGPSRRPPVDLGPDGAKRAAELVLEVLCRAL